MIETLGAIFCGLLGLVLGAIIVEIRFRRAVSKSITESKKLRLIEDIMED